LIGGAWHPDSWVPHFRGSGALQRIGVPGILSGSAMREDRATIRAVSDDFGSLNASNEESDRAQTSSGGALLGSALGEAGLTDPSASPEHRDRDGDR